MYLVDTNVFLEAILEQEKTSEVRLFFQSINLEDLYITNLSIHSIGIILFRLKEFELFVSFMDDMIVEGMNVISLSNEDVREIHKLAQRYNLDFDDVYQYLAAEKYDLQIISFDRHFDDTERGRKRPKEVMD